MRFGLLLLLCACGTTGQQLQAEALRATSSTLTEMGEFVEGDSENPEVGCPGLVRALGPTLHAKCLRVGELQHAGVAVWRLWATAALAALAKDEFNLSVGLSFGRQLLDIFVEAAGLIPQLPDPPDFLLQLLGVSE